MDTSTSSIDPQDKLTRLDFINLGREDHKLTLKTAINQGGENQQGQVHDGLFQVDSTPPNGLFETHTSAHCSPQRIASRHSSLILFAIIAVGREHLS